MTRAPAAFVLTALLLSATAGCRSEPEARPAAPASAQPAGRAALAPASAVGAGPFAAAGRRAVGAKIPRIASVRDYRRSGDRPYWESGGDPRWTPEDVVRILREDPGYVVDMGIWTERPTGHPHHREVGRVVDEAQRLARARGIDPGRLAHSVRNDVFVKHSETRARCGEHCGWEGTMVDAPFDPSWILTVPRSETAWSIQHRWGGDAALDPWSAAGRELWPRYVDRAAMGAANTADRVGALYGGVRDADPSRFGQRWVFNVNGLVMDLRNEAYRAWSVKRILSDLPVLGIDPGEAAVLIYGYKPGWHTWYGGGRSPRQSCFIPGSHMWIGPAGPCPARPKPVAGLFHRTAYGPGEFETAINAMLRELRAGLVAAGYPDVVIATVERPALRKTWQVLDPELQREPWIIGELGAACHRLDVARSGPCPVP